MGSRTQTATLGTPSTRGAYRLLGRYKNRRVQKDGRKDRRVMILKAQPCRHLLLSAVREGLRERRQFWLLEVVGLQQGNPRARRPLRRRQLKTTKCRDHGDGRHSHSAFVPRRSAKSMYHHALHHATSPTADHSAAYVIAYVVVFS